MIYKSLCTKYLLTVFVSILSFSLFAQPSIDEGKNLFKINCAQCHAKDMKSALTGPALGGSEERWADYPQEDLYSWIRNSQKMISSGHPRATELWNEYKPTVMNAFPSLTDDNIASLLLYINDVNVNGLGGGLVSTTAVGGETEEKGIGNWIYWVLFGILALFALLLKKIINNLNKISAAKDGDVFIPKTFLETLTSKRSISILTFLIVVIGGYFTVSHALNLGRQQGYAPTQPIKFSHETHAGLHKIDCEYCHDGARRSKHAVIPAMNTCMNCHSAIKNGSEYGTAEISKIYAASGYNPNTNKYIEGYDDMTNEEIEKIFKLWITNEYTTEKGIGELDREGERLVKNQWDGIVSSLTNKQKTKIQGAVEWTRIHNLPDHVYFNHSQHVSVGQVECQDCHGKVESMEVLEQSAPLSMGWCINCHRETEVKFVGNEYYQSYAKYHEELANGTREKVTVADIGGLECQKCHY